ncbi:MAG: cation transporter [Acidobacteria bacterium]|nr:cation transporter [Acidobacteriota bacterium]
MHALTHSRSANWVVKTALVVTVALVALEFVAGALAHSLALISDAWVLSWIALYFEQKPPDHRKTFGYHRAGVLAAFVNGIFLVGVALFICYEGYERIMRPVAVATGTMLVVGAIALAVNGGIALALARERRNLNLRAVFIHNLGDALSNVGIIAGAWLIRETGQPLIDPIIAFLIAGMILWTAIGIIAESSNVLLESLPRGMRLEMVANAMLEIPGVREVHDVHIWSLGSVSRALSCHVRILDMPTSETEQIAHQLREVLERRFGITHTTIQFEHTHKPGVFHVYMPEPASPAKSPKG